MMKEILINLLAGILIEIIKLIIDYIKTKWNCHN